MLLGGLLLLRASRSTNKLAGGTLPVALPELEGPGCMVKGLMHASVVCAIQTNLIHTPAGSAGGWRCMSSAT